MASIRNSINKMNRELKYYKNSMLLNQSLLDEVEGVLLPAIITIGGTSSLYEAPVIDESDDDDDNDENNNNNTPLSKKPIKNHKRNKIKSSRSTTCLHYTRSELGRLEKEAVHRLNVNKTDERLFNMNKYKEYKRRAIKAYKSRQIFTVFGKFKQVRLALEHRGWIEKLQPDQLKPLQSLSQHSLLNHARTNNDYEKMSLSRLVQNYPSFFIWQPKQMLDTYSYLLPYRNRIRCGNNLDYATKMGLLGCTENAHWNTIDNVAELRFPRFYRLDNVKCKKEFLIEYRLMQCLSLINFILFVASDNRNILYDNDKGTISIDIIYFAFAKIDDFIKNMNNQTDLTDDDEDEEYFNNNNEKAEKQCDGLMETGKKFDLITNSSLMDEENSKEKLPSTKLSEEDNWKYFINRSRKIINKKGIFKMNFDDYSYIYKKCEMIFKQAKEFWPTLHMDGYNNLWILKPGFQSRGVGIVILKDYKKIVDYALSQSKSKYIVQKYIERPLLIYRTKFDIRQFILITITDTINIWMYKNCYLRFSSQNFSLSDLSESVHLTNHSVQKKYRNGNRSSRLPVSNMWSLLEFLQYLRNLDCPEIWQTIVYAGMKRNVIGVILSSLEELELVPNAFEIYGCDFILDEHFEPFLLEINASPDVSSSTPVTKKICSSLLEDAIKVVIDLPLNKKASTGDFELIYQIDYQKLQPNGLLQLSGDKI